MYLRNTGALPDCLLCLTAYIAKEKKYGAKKALSMPEACLHILPLFPSLFFPQLSMKEKRKNS